MRRLNILLPLFAAGVSLTAVVASWTFANTPSVPAPDAATSGDSISIEFEVPPSGENEMRLVGSFDRRQTLVTAIDETGRRRDATRDVTYRVEPAGVASIDPTGWITPLADGRAILIAELDTGARAETPVVVDDWDHNPPVNFSNQVVPVFTKHGCNGGGCHGKSGGQNGFRLSLLGFVPTEDYEYITREAFGRRLMLAAPERSLLLRKATAIVPHGGGEKLQVDGPSYQVLHRWISEGARFGDPAAAKVDSITVVPADRIMDRNANQQLVVLARYTDGRTEDVTRMAQFEANIEELASVTESGLVTTTEQTGDVAVMIRYQSQVAVFRATVPLGESVADLPPANNFIDELVFHKLQQMGMPPSGVCTDETFLRRATIDIAGRLPTLEETIAFLNDDAADKRAQCVDRLLASEDHADYFANKWSAILRNRRDNDSQKRRTYAFHDWIRDAIYENMPYDQFVSEIIASSGEVGTHPPVAWYAQVDEVNEQVEDAAQLFLGLRIQCARCHHHPYEKWSEDDYYGFAAFFSRVGRKSGDQPGETRIFHRRGDASAVNPRTKQPEKPTPLGGDSLDVASYDDPRRALVAWMTEAENPFFAKTLVNRYWKHFFDRGLVDPEDDMRETNPPSNPELLDALAAHFAGSGFDARDLIRTICTSQVYQLESDPNAFNLNDKQNYSRFYPRRLNAEVLLDAVDQLLDAPTDFAGVPKGTRAVALPDTGTDVYFLSVFGQPQSASACECERTTDANLAQSLHLLNSTNIQAKLAGDQGTPARLAADEQRSEQEKFTEIYLRAFCRAPTDAELATVTQYVASKREQAGADAGAAMAQTRVAYEDVIWALINSKEFLFNH